MQIHRILEAKAEANHKVWLRFETGEPVTVDMAPAIRLGGVFQPLNNPDFYAQVSVGDRGRVLQWPGELEFCADALWLESHGRVE